MAFVLLAKLLNISSFLCSAGIVLNKYTGVPICRKSHRYIALELHKCKHTVFRKLYDDYEYHICFFQK